MIRLQAVEVDDWPLLHEALRDPGDDRADDPDGGAEDVEEGREDGLKHNGKVGEWLMWVSASDGTR